jgi:putative ABC transport system permease protein
MFINFLKTAWRSVTRNKSYSTLNILGFAVGFACSLLLLLYTWHELTYDQFHVKNDQIYLVAVDGKAGDEEWQTGWTTPPLGPAMERYFPEVLNTARVCFWFEDGGVMVQREDKQFMTDIIIGADSTIFNIFTIPFIQGDPKTALANPNSVVITRATAEKYFGDENPVGKTLNFDLWFRECQVTGVVEDYPEKSHFAFDIIVSLNTWHIVDFADSWYNHTFSTYALMHPEVDITSFEKKLPQFIKIHHEPYMKKQLNTTYDEYYSGGNHYKLFMVPIEDVHLSNLIFSHGEGKKLLTYAVGLIGVIIILLASMNYINLSTALSLNRAKEVGIRKTAGGSRQSLMVQFLTESVITTSIGLLIGLVIAESALPFFERLTGQSMQLSFFDLRVIPVLFLFALVIGFLSGIYPALVLTSFRPVHVLKGRRVAQGGKQWLRNGLIIFQFTACLVLIVTTTVVYNQLNFMTKKSLGFDANQVLVIKHAHKLGQKALTFKEELLGNAAVSSVSFTNTLPGRHFDGHSQHFAGDPPDVAHTIVPLIADKDILETLDLEVVFGQDFRTSGKTGPMALLNEAAVEQLKLENPLSKQIDSGTLGDETVPVVGIVQNFHFQSFHHDIEPLVIYHYDLRNGASPRQASYVLIELMSTDYHSVLNQAEQTWTSMTNSYPFEHTFLDADFARLFEREQTMAAIYTLFSAIAIIIASLGLLGLTSFYTSRRNKEIGIRKVIGASVASIITLLSAEFGKLVFSSLVIGIPTSWILMNRWLDSFAFRTNLDWWIFFVAGTLTIFIAMMTVTAQTVKAAYMNPSDTLRHE